MPDDILSNLVYSRNQYGVTGVSSGGQDLLTPTIDESAIKRGSITIGASPITGGTSQTVQPVGTKSISSIITPSNLEAPEMADLPELVLPEMDEERVSELTRDISDPAIRALRRETRTALGRHYENPNVAKMVARSALSGFGESLASVLSSAGTQARAEERAERVPETTKALTEYQAKISQQNQVYQAAWNNYLNQIQNVQTSTAVYPSDLEEQTSTRIFQ